MSGAERESRAGGAGRTHVHRGGGDLPLSELFIEFGHGQDVAHRGAAPQRARLHVHGAPGGTELFGALGHQPVQVRPQGGLGKLVAGAGDVVEQQVALQLGGGVAAGQHEVDVEAEPGAGGGRLAAVVGLYPRAPHDQVGALVERLAEQEFVVARLVAAECEAGAVVALDEHARPAEVGREPRHFLQRGGQMRQRHAWQAGGAPAQVADGGRTAGGVTRHQPDADATGCRLGVRSSGVCGQTIERRRGVSRSSSAGDGW